MATVVHDNLIKVSISPTQAPKATILVNRSPLKIVSMGLKGDKGDKGDQGTPGNTVNISALAGDNLGGHRVVQIFDGVATYANNQDAYNGQLAFTDSSADIGTSSVFFVSGIITEPTWNLVIGPVYLGTNGLITQTKPETGTVVLVGRAISATSISLNFQQLYRRL